MSIKERLVLAVVLPLSIVAGYYGEMLRAMMWKWMGWI